MTYPWLTFHTHSDEQAELIGLQKDWEHQCIQRGIDRVRRVIDEAEHKAVEKRTGGLGEMDAGAAMVRAIIRPMAAAIKEQQEEALEGLKTPGRRARWWIPVLSLEAEKWALITLKCVLHGLSTKHRDTRLVTGVALGIAKYGKLQREFDLWKAREAEARKETSDHVDLYRLMVSRVKEVKPRTVRRWMKLSKLAETLEWTKEDRIHVGMKMIEALVTHGGGWFEMQMVHRPAGRGFVTERRLYLTEKAKEFIIRKNSVTELQSPFLAPMLCPPDPWRYEEKGTAHVQ